MEVGYSSGSVRRSIVVLKNEVSRKIFLLKKTLQCLNVGVLVHSSTKNDDLTSSSLPDSSPDVYRASTTLKFEGYIPGLKSLTSSSPDHNPSIITHTAKSSLIAEDNSAPYSIPPSRVCHGPLHSNCNVDPGQQRTDGSSSLPDTTVSKSTVDRTDRNLLSPVLS